MTADMGGAHKNLLGYLQALPDPAKKRVLIVATVIIMALVVYFWLAYFNTLIAGVSQGAASVAESAPAGSAPAATSAPSSAAVPPAATGGGIGEQLRSGMGFIYGEFAGLAHDMGNIFEAPGQYSVQPSK